MGICKATSEALWQGWAAGRPAVRSHCAPWWARCWGPGCCAGNGCGIGWSRGSKTSYSDGTHDAVQCLRSKSRKVAHMLRLLTAILAITLSVAAMAAPVLACSVGSGCCPTHTQPPCADGIQRWQGVATVDLCCGAAPTSTYAPIPEPRRVAQSALRADGPNHLVMGNSVTPGPRTAVIRPVFPTSIPAHGLNAALTYLRTGRLRL